MALSKLKQRSLEFQANTLRTRWGLSAYEPIPFRSLLLDQGVLTVFKSLSAGISGMALKVALSEPDEAHRFMLINASHSVGRQHFTICHELYHLFVQESFTNQICTTGQFQYDDPEEIRADWFAAYLLMPEEGIYRLIPEEERKKKDKISLATILRLEQYFATSHSAMLVRLRHLNLISVAYAETIQKGVAQQAKLYGHSTQLYQPGKNDGEIIGDYGSIARKLLQNEQISESHYAELMQDIGIDVFADEPDVQPNAENLT